MHPDDRSVEATTRVFALLGDPVAHSLSPRIHNVALAAEGLDGVYVALRCADDAVAGLMRGLAQAGGGGSVTVPHKHVAAAAVEVPSEAVQRTGACNTFWLEHDRVVGENTDVPGFDRAVRAFLGDPRGARVLLVGAGGAAAAALLALLRAGAESIAVLTRAPERAEELVARLTEHGRASVRVLPSLESAAGERFDLAINATPLGLQPDDAHPLPIDGDMAYAAALDLVYAPGGTAWVRAARRAGLPATDGHEMLLQQAAVAFEHWWQRPAPLTAMRVALLGDDPGTPPMASAIDPVTGAPTAPVSTEPEPAPPAPAGPIEYGVAPPTE